MKNGDRFIFEKRGQIYFPDYQRQSLNGGRKINLSPFFKESSDERSTGSEPRGFHRCA